MTSEREFFSLSDGDVVLRSSDGIDFRVDSTVLRRASPFFASMFQLPQPNNQPSEPIPMMESGVVLDDILRSIYPSTILPTPSSAEHALALSRAVQRLDISNPPLSDTITQYIGSIEPSIRAWALALNVGDVEARKMAVKRFICDNSDLLGQHHLDELGGIDATIVLKLGWLREHVRQAASEYVKPIGSLAWGCCSRHGLNGIHLDQLRTTGPANSFAPTEEVLQVLSWGTRCGACLAILRDETATVTRQQARTDIENLLERAACMESGTLEMNSELGASVFRVQFQLILTDCSHSVVRELNGPPK